MEDSEQTIKFDKLPNNNSNNNNLSTSVLSESILSGPLKDPFLRNSLLEIFSLFDAIEVIIKADTSQNSNNNKLTATSKVTAKIPFENNQSVSFFIYSYFFFY